MTREFRVTAGDVTILHNDFERAPVDYSAEFAYWGAVRSLTGMGLTFTLGPDDDGSFQRVVATKTDAAVATIASHAKELNALVRPNGMETIWRLPGVIRYGDGGSPLPEPNILAFMVTMVDRSNLLDSWTTEPPPGVNIWLPGQEKNGPPLFVFVMDGPTSQEESDAHWKLGLDVAREALALGLPQMGMGIQTYGHELDEDSYIHVGKCVKLIPPTAADRKLAADLIAGGIDLPDTAIGECIAFATP